MKIVGRIFGILVIVVASVLAVIFAMANRDAVILYFMDFYSQELPLFIWLYITFGIGLLVGILAMVPRYVGVKLKLRKALRQDNHDDPDSVRESKQLARHQL